MITCGSLFAGIGGFELGAQWAFESAGIPHKVLFQVEQNKFCQKILKKHWPDAQLFKDVRAVGRHNLPDIDILMGGFPCQDISVAGHQKGIINGKKSGLWFEMLRIISELRPAIAVLENVPAILRVGGPVVVGSLAKIGYDTEWQIISAAQFGAPHLRKRWFCVATDTDRHRESVSAINAKTCRVSGSSRYKRPDWQRFPTQSAICSRDDGIPSRMARLRALGNAIVPQCSEFIFNHIIKNVLQSQQQKEQ
jgi:DNA (cytosine-5)-methyltransferase 1